MRARQLRRAPTSEVIGKPYDVFISYRVASDAERAERLYDALTSLGMVVWWDKVRLQPGQRWEDGFMDGQLDSKVTVPLISCAVLRGFAKLRPTSQGNVLVEHSFALELNQRRELRGLVPLLVGEHDESGVYRDFFAARAASETACELPEFALPSVNRLLKRHMRRKEKGVPLSKAGTTATVKEVVSEMLEFQGVLLNNEDASEMARAADSIATAVENAKEVRTPRGTSSAETTPRHTRSMFERAKQWISPRSSVADSREGSRAESREGSCVSSPRISCDRGQWKRSLTPGSLYDAITSSLTPRGRTSLLSPGRAEGQVHSISSRSPRLLQSHEM